MVRYDLQNEKEDVNVTILSTKGTSHKNDVYMDFQLFIPSVFYIFYQHFLFLEMKIIPLILN